MARCAICGNKMGAFEWSWELTWLGISPACSTCHKAWEEHRREVLETLSEGSPDAALDRMAGFGINVSDDTRPAVWAKLDSMKDIAAMLIGKKGLRQVAMEKTVAQMQGQQEVGQVAAEEPAAAPELLPLATTSSLPGLVVARHLGIVSGEAAGASASEAREAAFEALHEQASALGARAVLAVSVDHVLLGDGRFLAIATGTAVVGK